MTDEQNKRAARVWREALSACDGPYHHDPDVHQELIDQAATAVIAREFEALEAEVKRLREAVMAVVSATRSYLPPDGISERECLNRIIAATDNPIINPIILEAENGCN